MNARLSLLKVDLRRGSEETVLVMLASIVVVKATVMVQKRDSQVVMHCKQKFWSVRPGTPPRHCVGNSRILEDSEAASRLRVNRHRIQVEGFLREILGDCRAQYTGEGQHCQSVAS